MNRFWQYDPIGKNLRVAKVILLLIVFLAGWLRVYRLDISPPGFYADEASIGYNAYSVLKTGKDEYGVSWPLFFRAFGEYKNPVFIYSLAPLIYWRGLTPETIRLGAALWGSLGVLVFSLVAMMVSSNFTFTALATMVLALIPWHLHYSRIGFEAVTFPTLLLISLGWFLIWLKKKKNYHGLGVGLVFGLTFYSYTTARLWLGVFLLILLLSYRKLVKKSMIGSLMMGVGAILWPLIGWLKNEPGSLMARMNQIAIWSDKPGWLKILERFGLTYSRHFSIDFLFGKGDATLRHASGISSEILVSFGLFLIVGLIVTIKYLRKKPIWKLTLLMIALFPLAASLTLTSPIATRTIQATPFFALVIGLGMWWSMKKARNRKVLLLIFVAFWVMVIGLEFKNYYDDLLYEYPKRVWVPWHGFDGSLGEGIVWSYEKSKNENVSLYLSDGIEQVYVQGLFFTQADPNLWQSERQAPFEVASGSKVTSDGVWLVTADECKMLGLKLLKTFGRESAFFDYCAVRF